MRLWSLHPKYLDAQGLVALWREALLAREVLRGRTAGYRHHPQLERFRLCVAPRSAINGYLMPIYAEAVCRGYDFDRAKLGRVARAQRILVSDEQLRYEWSWLQDKLRRRSPAVHRLQRALPLPMAHPLFEIVQGPVATWERVQAAPAA